MRMKINKKSFMLCIFFVFLIIISVFLLIKFEDKYSWIGVIIGAIGMPFSAFWKNFVGILHKPLWEQELKRLINAKKINNEDNIRISFAYLFRIKVNGKYLLVLNERCINKFQPVGGAYKCYKEEKIILGGKNYNVVDDDLIQLDKGSKNDYRMRVPVPNLKRFMGRFDKTSNRETVENLTREFKEELLVSKDNSNPILSKSNFTEIEYIYRGRHITGLEYNKYSNTYEILLADIVELLPTENQIKELEETQHKISKRYCWATEDIIRTCGVVKGTKKMKETITNHSFKVLESTSKELIATKDLDKTYKAKVWNEV